MTTWHEVFFQSPGPSTWKDARTLFLKGIFMGSADIVPGVSGGTIALITGIYRDLLSAIESVDVQFARRLLRGDVKKAAGKIHLRFLITLLFGIATGIICLSGVIHHFLHEEPIYTWSLFFGLILASVVVVAKKAGPWKLPLYVCFCAGGTAAYFILSLIPVSTPNTIWIIFGSGFIAICAMILPGISGAFILVLLGKYVFITGCLRNPFLPNNFFFILIFCLGCACGLLVFSRVLHFLIQRFPGLSMAALTGFMAGSMKKIWPWKAAVETKWVGEKLLVLQEKNVFPESIDEEVIFALLFAAMGFAAVWILHKISGRVSQEKT